MKMIKDFLTDSAKANLANTIYTLMNNWEEDRGAIECEACFDLYDKDDFKLWVDMYGIDCAITCHNASRYWVGGCNFSASEIEREKEHNGWCVHSMEMNEKDLNWILGEIEDRVEYNVSEGNTIENCEKIYSNLINLNGYFSQDENKDVENYIRDIYSPSDDFDGVDMEISLENETKNNDGDTIQFYWVKCSKNGESCNMDYSCIKFNGKIYLPYGERDVYPFDLNDIWEYKWINKENTATDYLYFDRHCNSIHEDEQRLLWLMDDVYGKEYLPNFLEDIPLETTRVEVIQEFTITLWEKYKDHINNRDAFLKYCKECADHFISLYNHTNFMEEDRTYYEYLDNYIDKMCDNKAPNFYTISKENWYC